MAKAPEKFTEAKDFVCSRPRHQKIPSSVTKSTLSAPITISLVENINITNLHTLAEFYNLTLYVL